MKVTYLGGANEIGASCALLELEGTRLLVDCGQRLNAPPGQALPDFSCLQDGPPLSAVIITHAHADHIGGLPALEPFLPADCPLYATEATIDLARVMLMDSLRIMTQHRAGDGELAFFAPPAIHAALARFKPVRWGKALRLPGSHLSATWFPAGHVLGAAMVEIRGRKQSALFSGDVSVTDQLGVCGLFAPAARPNLLVLESTYGSRLHAHRPTQEQRILERVKSTIANGGYVLFPTFALGRAQEVLLLLGKAMRAGKLPEIPVYADGLVRAVSKVYARRAEDASPFCRRLWEQGLDPIFPEDLPIRPVRDDRMRERVALGVPCVVVSSSGMLQGGASQFYGRHWIADEKNLILITGYQDEESPGQALLSLAAQPADQPRWFKMGGVRVLVGCQVESAWLSAHADNGELVALAHKFKADEIHLVHGDDTARTALSRGLLSVCRSTVVLPQNGESYVPDAGSARIGGDLPERRPSPLAAWPPWDPRERRPLDLAAFHSWLAAQDPKISWVTLDELAEMHRGDEPATAEEWAALRKAVYEAPQPYFVPDAKRPYILHVANKENLLLAGAAPLRSQAEHAAATVREIFPPESGLERFGFYPETHTLRLQFRFPRSARLRQTRAMADLHAKIGWALELDDATAEDDLAGLASRLLAPSWNGAAPPTLAIDHAAGVCRLPAPAETRPGELEEAAAQFESRSGYLLEFLPSP